MELTIDGVLDTVYRIDWGIIIGLAVFYRPQHPTIETGQVFLAERISNHQETVAVVGINLILV